MGAITIQQMADRVAGLMEDRLRIRGNGLADKLGRGGGRLPRKVRAAAGRLAEAAHMSQNPKLLLQVDEGEVAEAYDICVRYLAPLGAAARRKGLLMGMAAQITFGFLVLAAGVLLVLKWRGLV
ncbi:hypothetical protein KM031_13750 [Gemmobacter fulvus]|uniref:Uncharacterized protein n=1 Tax=Gemmobacter fulvus TaxID=2840474 RepID=A0A975S1B4_9RHOB|nr:hypothetical protein [Gemmobacter fulvus]MBT9247610.1 hypothetical protein [Gemmobacter fulvus]MDQ1847541.1 hypothetical protein [Gemmobacter fulvus]QWK89885.1 hypothetical protein KM031_13750 [Gemmobacter fulvus]